MNNEIILSTADLSIGYLTKKEKIVIASHLNLNLKTGRLISLVGANGIGKSTLLRTLCGIQKPLSGQTLLNQKDILAYDSIGSVSYTHLDVYKRQGRTLCFGIKFGFKFVWCSNKFKF